MKKVFSMILTLCTIFAMSTSVFASNGNDNSKISETANMNLLKKLGYTVEEVQDYKGNPEENGLSGLKKQDIYRLAQLGYSKDEINEMTEQELQHIEGWEGTLINVDEKYIKVTKDGAVEVPKLEAEKQIKELKEKQNKSKKSGEISTNATSDTETTSWMVMTTSVSYGSGEYTFKNSFEWRTEPVFTLEDAVGISHPEYIAPVTNSEYLKYTYDRYTNDFSHSYINTNSNYLWSANDKNSNGMAFKYDLLGSEYYNGVKVLCENPRGLMVYRATKANPDFTTGHLYGHYTHTEGVISGSIGVKISLNSLSVSGATKTTEMTDTGFSFPM